METFNDQLAQLRKLADFGTLVLEAAKEAGLVPKRASYKVRTVTKTKFIVRRPRKARVEQASPQLPVGPSAEVERPEPKKRGRPRKQAEVATPTE